MLAYIVHIPSEFAHLLHLLKCCSVGVAVKDEAVKDENKELVEGVERSSLPSLSLVFYTIKRNDDKNY